MHDILIPAEDSLGFVCLHLPGLRAASPALWKESGHSRLTRAHRFAPGRFRDSAIRIILSINQWFDQHLRLSFAESQRSADLCSGRYIRPRYSNLPCRRSSVKKEKEFSLLDFERRARRPYHHVLGSLSGQTSFLQSSTIPRLRYSGLLAASKPAPALQITHLTKAIPRIPVVLSAGRSLARNTANFHEDWLFNHLLHPTGGAWSPDYAYHRQKSWKTWFAANPGHSGHS
jgi:hypothetical protein